MAADVSIFAALYEAAVDLMALEPSNAVLREAVDAFETALVPADKPLAAQWGADTAQALHRAAEEHRRVRITYARQWHPGTRERVVEPYRLVRTRRGWEVDAGPPDERAAVRTYLVSGITALDVTEETFSPDFLVAKLVYKLIAYHQRGRAPGSRRRR